MDFFRQVSPSTLPSHSRQLTTSSRKHRASRESADKEKEAKSSTKKKIERKPLPRNRSASKERPPRHRSPSNGPPPRSHRYKQPTSLDGTLINKLPLQRRTSYERPPSPGPSSRYEQLTSFDGSPSNNQPPPRSQIYGQFMSYDGSSSSNQPPPSQIYGQFMSYNGSSSSNQPPPSQIYGQFISYNGSSSNNLPPQRGPRYEEPVSYNGSSSNNLLPPRSQRDEETMSYDVSPSYKLNKMPPQTSPRNERPMSLGPSPNNQSLSQRNLGDERSMSLSSNPSTERSSQRSLRNQQYSSYSRSSLSNNELIRRGERDEQCMPRSGSPSQERPPPRSSRGEQYPSFGGSSFKNEPVRQRSPSKGSASVSSIASSEGPRRRSLENEQSASVSGNSFSNERLRPESSRKRSTSLNSSPSNDVQVRGSSDKPGGALPHGIQGSEPPLQVQQRREGSEVDHLIRKPPKFRYQSNQLASRKPQNDSQPSRQDENLAFQRTSELLAKLIGSYHSTAKAVYLNNPESLSIMLLTMMELWVACDRSATTIYPLLLDYRTGFPQGLLDPLVLPKREQMNRLSKVENYLAGRRSRATKGPPWELSVNGSISEDSFAVRYYDSSDDHRSLHHLITMRAKTMKAKKLEELESQKHEYDRLMREYETTSHHFEKKLDDDTGDWTSTDSPDCPKCKAGYRANNMRIAIFQWPLPEDEIAAKATIFELRVPQVILVWRNTTLKILLESFNHISAAEDKSRREFYLATQDPVVQDVIEQKASTETRFQLASKSRLYYYDFKPLSEANPGNICVKNGCRYDLYDTDLDDTIQRLLGASHISLDCSYHSDTVAKPLKKWILSSSHSLNDVIANQASCPTTMSLEEFKAFGNLRGGILLQWQNIASQLTIPTLNFNKPESFFLIMQAANEAGPRKGDGWLRDAHDIVADESFSQVLLSGLRDGMSRIRENWESDVSLCIFVSLATRLLSISPSQAIQAACLVYLADIRRTSIKWARILLENLGKTNSVDERGDLNRRVLMMALICHATFDVGDAHLPSVLSVPEEASLLLESSMITAEHNSPHTNSSDPILVIFLHRWRKLSYEVEALLKEEILNPRNPCLDMAITKIWAAYLPGTKWSIVQRPSQHLLITKSSDQQPLYLQYNLLTGSLLVNGSPLSTLPRNFQSHETYKRLFGDQIINVMPSAMADMRFSATNRHFGHTVHFGMYEDDLIIRTRKGKRTYQLIPIRNLKGDFPFLMISNYAHWLVVGEDKIEFRALDNAWQTFEDFPSSEGLTLHFKDDTQACLVKNSSSTVIDSRSLTANMLSEILRPLEHPGFIHLTLNQAQSILDVELPRFGLSFSLASRDTVIKSNHSRGFIIDSDQHFGTLSGLENKLVLRPHKNISDLNPRAVIVPHGNVSFTKGLTGHASTKISTAGLKHVQHHFFQIDTRLGRLKDAGTVQSKLLLCLLHAFTTHCLPDELTGRSGTDEALRLLNSAAMKSFDRLRDEEIDLLNQIANISPRRQFYPKETKYMQIAEWSSLSPLAQHDAFYESVQSILLHAQDCELFFPQNRKEAKLLSHSAEDLIKRQSIRTSAYRVSQFGAEQYTTSHDIDYVSRDTVESSDAEYRIYRLTKFLDNGDKGWLLERVLQSSMEKISRIVGFSQGQQMEEMDEMDEMFYRPPLSRQPNSESSSNLKAQFEIGWLQPPSATLRTVWCDIQNQLSQCDLSRDKYRIMMFFAALTFSKGADQQIIQTLLAFATIPSMRSIRPPGNHRRLLLSDGALVDQVRLKKLAEKAKIGFSYRPESPFSSDDDNSFSEPENSRKYEEALQDYNTLVCDIIDDFVIDLQAQWPCEKPSTPGSPQYTRYLQVDSLMDNVRPLFRSWFRNKRFQDYLSTSINKASALPAPKRYQERFTVPKLPWKKVSAKRFVDVADLFRQPPPPISTMKPRSFEEYFSQKANHNQIQPEIRVLLDDLGKRSKLPHEQKYVKELRLSLKSFEENSKDVAAIEAFTLRRPMESLNKMFIPYQGLCHHEVNDIYTEIRDTLSHAPAVSSQVSEFSTLWPRVTPILLLEQFSKHNWSNLNMDWKECLIKYALSLTALHRAERLVGFKGNKKDLVNELTNVGHQNWDPMEFPETLLFEVENSLLVRPVQEHIASEMRQPSSGKNAVMQLNMGEGKSSVIVPIVAAALADGTKLVRIVITKPQSKQMMHILSTKLGGLLNRRVYNLPFSRELRLSQADAEKIKILCKECMKNGGVLLSQPEHILSFKLLGLESIISGKDSIGKTLLHTQYFFDNVSRDIVDESDENFSVKFELTYTMGSQNAIDFSPQRWILAQNVLGLVAKIAPEIHKKHPDSMEREPSQPGHFPRTRILSESVGPILVREIARRICDLGLEGFSNISRQNPALRKAILQYITKPELTQAEIAEVENRGNGFYNDSTFQPLLLLRGLLAGGLLVFALQQKRWRVNYGLDYNRTPPTRLAVPYRAKDSPAPRSEFSHPDIVIALTCLSYYYGGLRDDELFTAFEHLFMSDQGDSEYAIWIQSTQEVPKAFCHLTGVNVKDRVQCVENIFPHLRHVKIVIDYYLSKILFPKEMREFTKKLSASGWDIAKVKKQFTTGFSGTNDSKYLLPLSIGHLELPKQQHTNALVLNCLLRPENSVLEINPDSQKDGSHSVAESLLSIVKESNPKIQVILDVGAQILELGNLEVARRWLEIVPSEQADAAIFFDDLDELSVVTRNGFTESFLTSPYATHLDSCVVFLDEAHTRGTDLQLPDDYRAAVTLGPNLSKDRLVQACMRMRKLGKGQSVVFFIPSEIRRKITKLRNISQEEEITTVDVLRWAISETWYECHKSIPLWATQGTRHQWQEVAWNQVGTQMGTEIYAKIASTFLEDESQSLSKRYSPSAGAAKGILGEELQDPDLAERSQELRQIKTRCEEFGVFSIGSATLHEEQEREISTEVEEERQIRRPSFMEPHVPSLHADVEKFVRTGQLHTQSKGFRPAFMALKDSSVARLVDLSQFSSEILVTEEFVRTVKPGPPPYISDQYQRPVQWIVTSFNSAEDRKTVKHMVIFSPWEVNWLLPIIRHSHAVMLHMYTPRPNLSFRSIEDLTLYTIPSLPDGWAAPRKLILQLNLLAGQLYLRTYPEYTQLCNFLGISYQTSSSNTVKIGADGFVGRTRANPNCIFTKSPVPFLRVLVTQICRDCQDIGKTDLGRILAGELLTKEHFTGRELSA
ncbi:hypothetical protein G7Y89_g3550 [Cudoniella acicularis]|uniref:ubiquitinyl hydrolase 1 n=1 Tax=Cudoniella acicularis TaxID=354080 RepID=A0A8H4RT53_9HELO|nr:hypothetical protein G7Y89_g3550 [Cudoniella acicularis]